MLYISCHSDGYFACSRDHHRFVIVCNSLYSKSLGGSRASANYGPIWTDPAEDVQVSIAVPRSFFYLCSVVQYLTQFRHVSTQQGSQFGFQQNPIHAAIFGWWVGNFISWAGEQSLSVCKICGQRWCVISSFNSWRYILPEGHCGSTCEHKWWSDPPLPVSAWQTIGAGATRHVGWCHWWVACERCGTCGSRHWRTFPFAVEKLVKSFSDEIGARASTICERRGLLVETSEIRPWIMESSRHTFEELLSPGLYDWGFLNTVGGCRWYKPFPNGYNNYHYCFTHMIYDSFWSWDGDLH